MKSLEQARFRDKFVKYFSKEGDDYRTIEQYLFGNWQGTRLSHDGYKLAKSEFKSYPFTIPNDVKLTIGNTVSLNKSMVSPYYLNSRVIVFFSESDANHYALVDDIILFIKSISE